jgi:hypothetical protein
MKMSFNIFEINQKYFKQQKMFLQIFKDKLLGRQALLLYHKQTDLLEWSYFQKIRDIFEIHEQKSHIVI